MFRVDQTLGVRLTATQVQVLDNPARAREPLQLTELMMGVASESQRGRRDASRVPEIRLRLTGTRI